MNLYISALDYLKGTTGQETTSLTANLTRLSSNVSVGATSLPLVNTTTAQLNQYDTVTIFDGASSEVAVVSATTSAGASSIPVSAIANAHIASTIVCSDGANGSLASAIVSASAEVERFCEQSLWQQTYTNETLHLRTMSAAVNRDYSITFRPKHFPVTSLTGLILMTDVADTITLDPTQAIIDVVAQVVIVPLVMNLSGSQQLVILKSPLDQYQEGWLKITYQAGYTSSTLPYDIKQACIWLTSDLLSDRANSTGAFEFNQGKRRAQYGKGVGQHSSLVERAYYRLQPYKRKVY